MQPQSNNRMNYVLVACLFAIALSMVGLMVHGQLTKTTPDASASPILNMIVGGFLTMIAPAFKHYQNSNETNADATQNTTSILRTPPSGGSGVTSDKPSPPDPSNFPNHAK